LYLLRPMTPFFRNHKVLRALSIVGVVVLGFYITYRLLPVIFVSIFLYYPKVDFDKELWHSNPMDRYKMSDHIIKSQMLNGQSKEEVQELLGDFQPFESDRWGYPIGFPPSLGVDGSSLIIEFQSDTARLVTTVRN